MKKRTSLFIFGAALFASAALVVSAAPRPAAAQTSSGTSAAPSPAKKKKRTSAKSRRRGRASAQKAPTPDRIKEIQAALQKDGSYDGEPTGKWDAKTIDAMKRFQDKNGFSPTGKIDALSLNKLGLGSETAGKGAPTPATTASSSPAPEPASTSPASPPTAPPAQ